MAAVTLRMAMRRTPMVGVGVGGMAGAIVLASTLTIPGKDTMVAPAIILSSITVVAAVRLDMRLAAEDMAVAGEGMVVAEAIVRILYIA
jgi:hypothetical protein